MKPPLARIAAMLQAAPMTISGIPGRARLRRTAAPTSRVVTTYSGGPAAPIQVDTASENRRTWPRKPTTTRGAQRKRMSPRASGRPPKATPMTSPITTAYRMNIAVVLGRSGAVDPGGPGHDGLAAVGTIPGRRRGTRAADRVDEPASSIGPADERIVARNAAAIDGPSAGRANR